MYATLYDGWQLLNCCLVCLVSKYQKKIHVVKALTRLVTLSEKYYISNYVFWRILTYSIWTFSKMCKSTSKMFQVLGQNVDSRFYDCQECIVGLQLPWNRPGAKKRYSIKQPLQPKVLYRYNTETYKWNGRLFQSLWAATAKDLSLVFKYVLGTSKSSWFVDRRDLVGTWIWTTVLDFLKQSLKS